MVETLQTQKRGQLTDRIKEKSISLLGYEISQVELRLMAYAQYTLINSQILKSEHINEADREILTEWVSKGFVLSGVSPEKGRPMKSEGAKFKITKSFYDAMSEILWLGYVDLIN